MTLAELFPVYQKLSEEDRRAIDQMAVLRTVEKGTLLHNSSTECMGLLVLCSGQLRAYMTSEEGREITLYRLFDHDICLFSASCVMPSVQFEVVVEAEKDCDLWVIPSCLFKNFMEESAPVANYANQLISSRFSEVMWLMEQIMWRSFDKRLAAFLLEESTLEDTTELKITHEKIANHMGTAREVVTRMLRYFQNEGLVKLTRGTVELTNIKGLRVLDNQ